MRPTHDLVMADDQLCDSIIAEAESSQKKNETPAKRVRRWLHQHDLPVSRTAVIDTLIHTTVEIAVRRGMERHDVVGDLREEFPSLDDAILASVFLDDVFEESTIEEDSLADAPPLLLPVSLGDTGPDGERRYELLRLIDEGADGRVYLAVDRVLGSHHHPAKIAIKVLKNAHDDACPKLLREARRMRRIDHQAVIKVYDAGFDANVGTFVVYDHCEGMTLRRWSECGSRSHDHAFMLSMLAAIARGVAAIHRSGVAHGDLHPGNVLVDEHGDPHIIDLGIGHSFVRDAEDGAVGALGFAAPELFNTSDSIDHQAADIYSLGALVFWCMTGKPVNGGSAAEFERWLHESHLMRERWMAPLPRRTDPQLAAVLSRALHPNPKTRYSSADELAEDLDRCRKYEPLRWTRPSPLLRARLAFRRSPIAWSGAALASILILLSMALTIGSVNRSRATMLTAALETSQAQLAATSASLAHAQAEEDRLKQAKSVAAAAQRIATAVARDSSSLSWLAPLVLLESAQFGDKRVEQIVNLDHRSDRIQILREAIGKAAANQDRPKDLQSILLEALLAQWLMDDGQLDEAHEWALHAENAYSTFIGESSSQMELFRSLRQKIENSLADGLTVHAVRK